MLVIMHQDHCFVVTKQYKDFGRSVLKRAERAPLSITRGGLTRVDWLVRKLVGVVWQALADMPTDARWVV